jgi:hypothetical protein
MSFNAIIFMSFHVISCYLDHFMSSHVILCHSCYSCHSCQFMSFMAFYIISCNFMSFCAISRHFTSFHFMSYHVSLDFFDQLSIKSGRAGQAGSNMSSYAFGDSFAVRPKAKMIASWEFRDFYTGRQQN